MSVSILMVRVLVEAVEHAGVPRDQLLAAAALDPRQLDDTQARLPDAEYERVQLAALQLSGDEALGLHMGEQPSSAAFDIVGHLADHAPTLRQCIDAIIRYSRIVSDHPRLELWEEGETASLRYTLTDGTSLAMRIPVELTMSGLWRLIRRFVGSDARLRRVSFEYEAPAYVAEYSRIFAGAEHFGQSFTGIEFERAWLDCTQLNKNPELYDVLNAQAERALGRLTRGADLASRVKEHLASQDPAHLPSMDEIARHFQMTGRSLRRRLVVEGTAYRSLVTFTLTNAAKRKLEDPRTSIQETAYAMGFKGPTAFHRAFKRWTGMTPKEYKSSY